MNQECHQRGEDGGEVGRGRWSPAFRRLLRHRDLEDRLKAGVQQRLPHPYCTRQMTHFRYSVSRQVAETGWSAAAPRTSRI